MPLLYRSLAVALTLAALPTSASAVAVVPLTAAQRAAASRPASARYHPRRFGPHAYYGTIVAFAGTRLSLPLRSGRTETADASQAIADNDYSQPLFVGKMVVIDGTYTNEIFVAAHIYRI